MTAKGHGTSVRTRLTLAMAVLAGVAFSVVALLAPHAVRAVLEDDLLVAEAENSSLFFTLDDPFDGPAFERDDLIQITDGDFFPIDPDLLFDLGGVFGGVFGDLFGEFELDSQAIGERAAEQVRVLTSIDRLDLLSAAAGGAFAIEAGPANGVIVEPDGTFELVDDLSTVVDDGIPVISSAEFEELLFDDSGLRPVGSGSFVDESDRRTIAGVVEVDGTRLLVAADASAVDRSVQRVRLGLWLAVPALTLIVAGVAWLLTSRALRPVGAITDRAATITGGSLDARVPVPDTGDEISTLAVTVNEMLDRLEADERTRRRFVSDASHELRSPVAVMRNDAEVALTHPETTDVNRLATVVAAESTRLSTIIDDLLALARSDEGVAAATGDIDLDDIVLADAARTRRVPVDTTHVSGGRIRGRPDEIGRLVGHLLDNAARHARTSVVVTLRTTDEAVELLIDDDGPGVPDDERQRVFERFVRLDEARTRDDGGAGLGLAVVRSIADRAGGSALVTTSPQGGARFTVSFPV